MLKVGTDRNRLVIGTEVVKGTRTDDMGYTKPYSYTLVYTNFEKETVNGTACKAYKLADGYELIGVRTLEELEGKVVDLATISTNYGTVVSAVSVLE